MENECTTPAPKAPNPVELDSTGKVPVGTLAARKVEANSALKQAEMERKFGEELRWLKKQADHYQSEYEAGRTKRKDLEAELEAVKADMAQKLKEAQAEAEETRTRGGDRGLRTELDNVRRELENVTAEKETLQSQLSDNIKANTKLLSELKERVAALTREKEDQERQLEDMARGKQQLEIELQQAHVAQEEVKQQVEVAMARVHTLTEELQESQDAGTKLQAEVAQLQEDLRVADERGGAREALIAASKGELEGAKQATAVAQQEAKQAKAECTQLRQKVQEAAQQAEALKEELTRTRRHAEQREQEAAELRANANLGGATAAAHQQALERTQQEYSDIKGEYARAVYEMAKAKAEHSEMAGKLAKVTQLKDSLHQRLNALQLAHTEVEHTARLALDDVQAAAQADQDGSVADAHSLGGNMAEGQAGGSNGGSSRAGSAGGSDEGAVRAVAMARLQLERVRKLARDALSVAVAERRATGGELERGRSLASATSVSSNA